MPLTLTISVVATPFILGGGYAVDVPPVLSWVHQAGGIRNIEHPASRNGYC
jgi:hypothetical protein